MSKPKRKSREKLFFVCAEGHIYYGWAVVDRVRQCTTCRKIITSAGVKTMAEARALASKRGKFAATHIQVFNSGKVLAYPREQEKAAA